MLRQTGDDHLRAGSRFDRTVFFLFSQQAIGLVMGMDTRGDPAVLMMGSRFLLIVATTLPLALLMAESGSIFQGREI